MRVIVCGDRKWSDVAAIKRELRRLPNYVVLVHGDCSGADRLAGTIGKQLGMSVEPYPADWEKYGSRAGPIRNQEMLDTKPDLVLAFHSDLSSSKGTAHMLKIARAAGVPCKHFTR